MYARYFKRAFDFILSLCMLIVLSPIFIALIALGAIEMRGNPFFLQERPGKDEKKFKLMKFRTMSNARDENGELLPDDQRLGKYGKILRSTSLDELPELVNIFIGDMSLIGPRPLLIRYLPYYTDEERKRHSVRPGLTGLAQVNGRNFSTWDEIFAYDVHYVEHCTFFEDVKIFFMTIKRVLSHSDISDATQGTEDSSGRKVHDALDIERGYMHEM